MEIDFIDTQIDLFSLQAHDPIENSCCVVLNGECQDLSWSDLFDSKTFDTLRCVTYVSSASFYEKAAGGFQKVQIIIGIEKGEVKKAFAESMRARIMDEGSKLFDSLPDKAKQRIISSDLEIRYSSPDAIIHSKFYLLSNSSNGKTRLIMGSANLTTTAFSNNVKQYEDIMVFDDSPLFEIYLRRFDAIRKTTIDYIPAETITKYQSGTLIAVADFTAEEKAANLVEAIKESNVVPVISEAILEQVQEVQAEIEKEQTETRATFEVIASVSKKSRKTGHYVLKTSQELEGAKTKIVDLLFRGTKKEQELARFALLFNEADKHQYRVFSSESDEEHSRPAELYDRKASQEEITNSLHNLNQFISAYRDFVSSPDPDNENLAHIFETVLYAFTSAYMFRLRQEAIPSRKTDIPIILVIGGRAASGKSSLLAYIDAILSGRHLVREDHYLQYENLTGKKTLEDLFQSENTYPLLVDEVAPGFFNSKSQGKGEAFIKYLANTLDGKHPAMICTTNTDSFNIPAQVARRVYYVQVDACFDDRLKGQASAYYEDVLAKADNLLFRDFCFRMADIIAHQEKLFGESEEEFDYLYCAREIFRQYYTEAGMEVPDYLPTTLYRDYTNRGREMWKVLFQQDQDSFNYTEVGKTGSPELAVNLKELTNGNRDVNVYLNYLRQDILAEGAGIYTILRADAFFEWIGVKNPWRKKTLLEKILRIG